MIFKLTEVRAIQKTADAHTNSKSARYRWLLNEDEEKAQVDSINSWVLSVEVIKPRVLLARTKIQLLCSFFVARPAIDVTQMH